jgi:hypothetical protein
MTTLRMGFVALAALITACGDSGDPEACRQADETAAQIHRAAAQGGISSNGICALSQAALEASVAADRAAQYLVACRRFAEQRQRCDGG